MSAASAFSDAGLVLPPTGSGVLDGLRFAVKDVFDVAGHVTGCGNPDWLRTHEPAAHTASAITRLLGAGATLLGKTVTDELAYSLNGENWHYGTPQNPRAPGRIPGGSSSGSASAVAADLVDVALGTDCGGSVRLPASYCGVYGMRPTHGRIAVDSLVPLAPGFDTVGWFAASADHLRRTGEVLLGEGGREPVPRRLVIARDFFAQLGAGERAALEPALERLQEKFTDIAALDIGDADPDALMRAFRILQAAQIWAVHGAWISAVQPRFGPGIRERFDNASRISQADIAAAQILRDDLCRRLRQQLAPHSLLCLPSAPGIAPLREAAPDATEAFRSRAMRMLCIAGLAGTPQVSIPVTTYAGCPLGLSLMMPRGADRALLDFVASHDLRERNAHDADINRPAVLQEVRAAFARYEQALVQNEVAVLDHLFWDSPATVRYGAAENLVGTVQIRAFRASRPAAGLMRTLHETIITTFGNDTATACTQFSRAGSNRIGRQTQTWVRTAAGWKVVAAHVSVIDPT